MRRPSSTTKADRNREDASVDSHYWDEGYQPQLDDPPNPVVDSCTEQALQDNDHDPNHLPLGSLHDVEVETVMTDASPAVDDTTAVPNHDDSPAISSPLQADSDDSLDYSESDIDLDADLPVHDQAQSTVPDHPPGASVPLTPGPSHDAENHDLDMSDDGDGNEVLSDQGYAIDHSDGTPEVDMQDASSVSANPTDSSDNGEAESESGPPTMIMDIDFSGFGLPMPGDVPPPQPAGPPMDDAMLLEFMNEPGPILISNPNPIMLGSENLGFHDLLRYWAILPREEGRTVPDAPYMDAVLDLSQDLKEITYSDLEGDSCDMQGIDWTYLRTTRRAARRFRTKTYKNYTNKAGSDVWMPAMPDVHIPTTDNFYRFRSLLIHKDTRLAHFQLRSVLACPSRTHAFYPGLHGISRINIDAKTTDTAVNLGGIHGLGSVVSALDANYGVLVAGMFNGEYCIKNLDSQNSSYYADGRITTNPSGITNHLQIYLPRRSSSPVAALANNDNGFRIMDLTTEEMLSETTLPYSINCSSMSPDGRLRVMVGDTFNVTVVNADNGQVEQELSGHRDFGFSCDWSDDGWTVATGFQDKAIKIWDARKWCDSSGKSTPVTTIRSKLASVRNLRFSPVGSGRKVLVAAEEADYVHVIDAQTFESKQTFDIFSEIGGVAFTNEGQNLNVLCSDSFRGGLLQFERCGRGTEPFAQDIDWRDGFDQRRDPYEPLLRRPALMDEVLLF